MANKRNGGTPKLPVQQLAILAVTRFAEPLAYTSVNPYLPKMIHRFGIEKDQVPKWAGITSSTFSIFQGLTAVPWGRAADRYGRKPILIMGLLCTMFCFIAWGMATSLTMAIAIRAIQGGSNGSVGIIRTMVAEMVPEKSLQPRAFSIMPFVWSLGSVVGPAFGGFFSSPAENYPDIFGKMEYFKRFPFALPNLLATVFFLISATSATLFLRETLSTKRDKKDWGLLVGERLTRAFSRRNPQRPTSRGRRTSSFVDGEATAPLVPVRAMPRNGGKDAQAPPKMSDVFTSQTLINLVAYALLAFHSVAYDQNIAVFMDYDVIERTPENYKLPFKFTGGFGMSEGQIGTIFTIYGITCGVIQFLFYPALVSRFGVLRCFRACCLILPLAYFLTPYTSLFATARGRYIALVAVMIVKAFGIIVAFPSTTILLTNSCTSLRVLGTLNGYATTFSAMGRAAGPASTGLAFSWGVEHGYIITAYYLLGFMAILGAIPAFMIVEGPGLTASVENSDSDREEDMDDSAVFLPNESAVEDDFEDDDYHDGDSGASRPLLDGRDDATKYASIKSGRK